MKRYILAVSALFVCVSGLLGQRSISEVSLSAIKMEGELYQRVCKNLDRLQEEKYQPQHVFLTEEASGNWPGDTEGRTILGLVLDAQASHREPFFLERIIDLIPTHLNERGYMGLIYKDKMNEQQVSGNGWMLRGLCEYYAWKKDERVLKVIRSIVDNLFVKGKGYYALYPIDPKTRKENVGAESGAIQDVYNKWMLSSDVGCVFIGMEGAIHAYQYLRTPELKEVIEEMIQRFLEIDLIGIKAQTHASLTACRGLVRYAELTGNKRYLVEAEKRWKLYRQNGMTENYENYNWFERFDTWSEPCAIVDSYLLAVQLWQRTGNPEYRNDAERIYYNAICHTQRFNGGFGCDNCPDEANPCLKIHAPEAHWCCTMRGGEGLASAVKYTYQLDGKTLYVPFYQQSELQLPVNATEMFALRQETTYPFGEQVRFRIKENTAGITSLKLPSLPWASDYALMVNNVACSVHVDNGFITLDRVFQEGDVIELSFKQKSYSLPMNRSGAVNCSLPMNHSGAVNRKMQDPVSCVRFFHGPLALGLENAEPIRLSEEDRLIPIGDMKFKVEGKEVVLSPIYHLLDPAVWALTYKNQLLF